MNKNTQQLPLMDFVKKDEVQELNAEIERLRTDNAELAEALKKEKDLRELIECNREILLDQKKEELRALREQLAAAEKDVAAAAEQQVRWCITVLPMLRVWRAMAIGFAPQGLNQQGVALLQRATTMIEEMAKLVK